MHLYTLRNEEKKRKNVCAEGKVRNASCSVCSSYLIFWRADEMRCCLRRRMMMITISCVCVCSCFSCCCTAQCSNVQCRQCLSVQKKHDVFAVCRHLYFCSAALAPTTTSSHSRHRRVEREKEKCRFLSSASATSTSVAVSVSHSVSGV